MPKKTLLVGINAKFIHSNLAIRCIKKYCEKTTLYNVELAEFTINQPIELIMREIYKQSPDILGFSCYIWNYEYVKELTFELKKLMPKCIFVFGGPEVSYNAGEVLSGVPVDFVVSGEGERSFSELLNCINTGEATTNIAGVFSQKTLVKDESKPALCPSLPPLALDDIDFVYDENFDRLANRIIYYESSRGCPFECQYCLSGEGHGVRFLSLERVFSDLDSFLKAGVQQVKFVDRTFNCNQKRTMSILRYICENDNQITNFHFEIAAELLDYETINFLNMARNGLFQLEIGVQSTYEKTLKAIKRITLPEKLTSVIKALQKEGNIHLHLDLIAGLPHEDYSRFGDSFNYVYSLAPNQLQLGFLKLLKGTGLHRDSRRYGLVCRENAPYEVLFTAALSFNDMLKLKMVEEMVETYYNSGRYSKELKYLAEFFPTPFDFFESLGRYYEENKLHLAPHSKVEYYEILFDFLGSITNETTHFKWLALFDIYSAEKAKKLPNFLDMMQSKQFRNAVFDFVEQNRESFFADYSEYDTKQILRMVHFEQFPFNPITGEKSVTTIMFRYSDNKIIELMI